MVPGHKLSDHHHIRSIHCWLHLCDSLPSNPTQHPKHAHHFDDADSRQFNRCFTTNVHAHVTAVYSAAIFGFIIGCVLHALPWTAGFVYNDVIALNVAAISAVVVTFIWAWKDFQTPFARVDPSDEEIRGSKLTCRQRMIAADRDQGSLRNTSWKFIAGTEVSFGDGSSVATSISDLLQVGSESAIDFRPADPWSKSVIQSAANLWKARMVTVTLVSREQFTRAGLDDCCSFSQVDAAGCLRITLGLFSRTELRRPSWKTLRVQVYVSRPYLTHSKLRIIQRLRISSLPRCSKCA